MGSSNGFTAPHIYIMLEAFYHFGARIQSNSWGTSHGSYSDDLAAEFDLFLWKKRDMVILFAQGNCYYIQEGDMNGIAFAKNVIAVGASINNEAAGFSCRGNIKISIKPDIIAPGVDVISSKARLPEEVLTNPNLLTESVDLRSGTSMSTPITAGAVALIRQYYREGWRKNGNKNCSDGYLPSGALLKATIINAGSSIKPNSQSGFGLINIGKVLRFQNSTFNLIPLFRNPTNYIKNVCDQASPNVPEYSSLGDDILENDEMRETAICAYDNSLNIKITLVWYDFPGNAANSGALNNDFDLLVNDTSSHLLYTTNDNKNTVEQIIIPSNLLQTSKPYRIKVIAKRIIIGPQSYSIIASGPIYLAKRIISSDNSSVFYKCDPQSTDNPEDIIATYLPNTDINPEIPITTTTLISKISSAALQSVAFIYLLFLLLSCL